jgi:hypothetical protein
MATMVGVYDGRASTRERAGVLRRATIRCACAWTLAGVVAFPLDVCAQPSARAETEPISTQYHPSAGCPEEAAFFAEVQARTARARRAVAGERARTFTIELMPEKAAEESTAPPGTLGRLTIQEIGGSIAVREVRAPRCAEAASAISVIMAVAIDPQASTQPIAAARPPPPAPSQPGTPAHGVRSNEMARSEHPPPDRAAPATWRVGLGMNLFLVTAVAPDPLLGPAGFVELSRRASSIWAPSARLTLLRGSSTPASTDIGTALFTWTAGRLEACPLRWPPRFPLVARPCALLELGELEGKGTDTVDPASESRTWVAAGALGRIEASLADAVAVGFELGATVPLRRYRFYFGPNTTVFEVPRVGASAGAGLAVRFP